LPARDNGKAPSLDDEALIALEDAGEPLAPLVRTYRDAARRAHTSGLDWLRHVAADGRVYAHYWQIGSVARRMSCQPPDLQNVPRATGYRACFRAPDGKALVRADYAQVELRIAAEIAQEPRMLAAYQRGQNLHALTAERVHGLPEGSVRKDHPAYPLGK